MFLFQKLGSLGILCEEFLRKGDEEICRIPMGPSFESSGSTIRPAGPAKKGIEAGRAFR